MNNTLTFDEQLKYLGLLLLSVDDLINVRVDENGRLICLPKTFGKMSDIYLQTLYNSIEEYLLKTCNPPTLEQIKNHCLKNGIRESIAKNLIDLLENSMKEVSTVASVLKKVSFIDNLEGKHSNSWSKMAQFGIKPMKDIKPKMKLKNNLKAV